MINREKEKETVRFLSDLVSLYDKHVVTTTYDYDYCAFNVNGVGIGFPEYQGQGYFDHYPELDKEGREKLQEVGDRLFSDEVCKEVDNPDADKIIEATPMVYTLKCRVYNGESAYVIVANAYNNTTGQYEQREKPAPIHEVFK